MGFVEDIYLSGLQLILVLIGCFYIVYYGHPEWIIAVYMSILGWNRQIQIMGIAHTWVFLAVGVLASVSYLHQKGRITLFPRTDRWIIPWMGLWWVWMLTLMALLDEPVLRLIAARNFLCFVVAPLPIFLVFAGDVKRVRGFAVAYIITSIMGGLVALNMLEVSRAMLLADPTLSSMRRIQTLGLYNYHWFSYTQAISLIMIAALFRENTRKVIRLALIAAAATCIYFLMMAGSRQSVISVFLALGLFVWWMVGRRTGTKLLMVLLLGLVFAIAQAMFEQAPQLMRARHAPLTDILSGGLEERFGLWIQGWEIFTNSPIWGTGFKDMVVSHNIFIGTLADQGVVGMVFFIGFLDFLVRQTRGVWRGRGPADLALWRMAFSCVALFGLFHSQASGSVISTFHLFWATAFLWHLGWVSRKSMLAYPPRSYAIPTPIVAGKTR